MVNNTKKSKINLILQSYALFYGKRLWKRGQIFDPHLGHLLNPWDDHFKHFELTINLNKIMLTRFVLCILRTDRRTNVGQYQRATGDQKRSD